MKVGLSMIDILTQLSTAAVAIMGALYHRDVRQGPGQHIDLALLIAAWPSLSHFRDELPWCRRSAGQARQWRVGGVPSQAFACADGDLFLVAGNKCLFRALVCRHRPSRDQSRIRAFFHDAGRIENREALARGVVRDFPHRTVRIGWIGSTLPMCHAAR